MKEKITKKLVLGELEDTLAVVKPFLVDKGSAYRILLLYVINVLNHAIEFTKGVKDEE